MYEVREMNDIFLDKSKYIKPEKNNWNEVLFEITSYCNLDCPFCLNDSSIHNNEFMSFDDFRCMIDKIKDKVQHVLISGGEPLANPQIVEMLDYLIQNNLAFRISTNGMLMTDEILSRFWSYPKASIQFSLDGADSNTDDRVRCPGHFKKIVSLMSELNERGFRNGITKMVISRLNYEQIEDFFSLGVKHNFVPTFAFLVKSGRAKNNWDYLCIDDSLKCKLRDKIRGLMDENVEHFRQYQAEELLEYLRNMNIDYVGECRFSLDCFDFSPLIHPDGSAHPCQGLQDREFCIGNLLTQSMDEIYSQDNPLVKKFARKVAERKRILQTDKCKQCALNDICGKGCVAEALYEGDFYGPAADCGMRKYDFMQRVLANREKILRSNR